jgi:hypothetical protein
VERIDEGDQLREKSLDDSHALTVHFSKIEEYLPPYHSPYKYLTDSKSCD